MVVIRVMIITCSKHVVMCRFEGTPRVRCKVRVRVKGIVITVRMMAWVGIKFQVRIKVTDGVRFTVMVWETVKFSVHRFGFRVTCRVRV